MSKVRGQIMTYFSNMHTELLAETESWSGLWVGYQHGNLSLMMDSCDDGSNKILGSVINVGSGSFQGDADQYYCLSDSNMTLLL